MFKKETYPIYIYKTLNMEYTHTFRKRRSSPRCIWK